MISDSGRDFTSGTRVYTFLTQALPNKAISLITKSIISSTLVERQPKLSRLAKVERGTEVEWSEG